MNHFHVGWVQGPSGPPVPTPHYGVIIRYDPQLAENLMDICGPSPLFTPTSSWFPNLRIPPRRRCRPLSRLAGNRCNATQGNILNNQTPESRSGRGAWPQAVCHSWCGPDHPLHPAFSRGSLWAADAPGGGTGSHTSSPIARMNSGRLSLGLGRSGPELVTNRFHIPCGPALTQIPMSALHKARPPRGTKPGCALKSSLLRGPGP